MSILSDYIFFFFNLQNLLLELLRNKLLLLAFHGLLKGAKFPDLSEFVRAAVKLIFQQM